MISDSSLLCGLHNQKGKHLNVEFLRALGSQSECVATYSGRPVVAKSFISSSSGSIALQSCSADVVFILGTGYLYLGVLRLCTGGGRYAVSVLVINYDVTSMCRRCDMASTGFFC